MPFGVVLESSSSSNPKSIVEPANRKRLRYPESITVDLPPAEVGSKFTCAVTVRHVIAAPSG